jgi:hypothetical protein
VVDRDLHAPAREVNRIARIAHRDEQDLHEKIQTDADFKVPEGSRRAYVFRFACMLRRWTADEELIRKLAMLWNVAHCEPVLTAGQVHGQVTGAMKKSGGQELEVVRLHELIERVTR